MALQGLTVTCMYIYTYMYIYILHTIDYTMETRKSLASMAITIIPYIQEHAYIYQYIYKQYQVYLLLRQLNIYSIIYSYTTLFINPRIQPMINERARMCTLCITTYTTLVQQSTTNTLTTKLQSMYIQHIAVYPLPFLQIWTQGYTYIMRQYIPQ